MRFSKKLSVVIVVGLFFLTVFVDSSFAVNAVTAARTQSIVVFDSSTHPIPLNDSGATTISFPMTSAGTVMIFFNAECAVESSDYTTFVQLTVTIDGVGVTPTSDLAFCTSNGFDANFSALSGWVSAGLHVVKNVGVGSHQVQIRATLRNFTSGERYRLDDTILTILK